MLLLTGIYIRVSTEEQVNEGFSLNAQKEKLTKYAELNDWDIFDYYIDDGISGKNIKDRPEINRMLNDIKIGKIKNVLVYKLDRLTRSLYNLMELINLLEIYDCSLNSHTEKLDTSNAVGRMFVKILGTFAEFERENLAERITFGYEQKTKEGNYTNTNGVYGYNYIIGEGKLEINQEEAKLVNRIYNLFLANYSMLKISKLFNMEKVPTKRGGKWAPSTIKSILTNPLYVGKVRYGVRRKHKTFLADGTKHLPIIEKRKYDNVQKLLNNRSNFNTKRYSSENTYYFHVLKCGNCGSKMHAKQQIKNGKTYITYICNGRNNNICTAPGFSHAKLEKTFVNYLSQLPKLLLDDSIFITDDPKKNNLKIKRKINKIKNKKSEIRNLFLEGSISLTDYKVLIDSLENKLLTFNNELQSNNLLLLPMAKIKEKIIDIKLNWDYLNNMEKKIFLERFIKVIEAKKEAQEVIIMKIKFNN